jgi:predicted enzyme related to lactoylglutathione lyase
VSASAARSLQYLVETKDGPKLQIPGARLERACPKSGSKWKAALTPAETLGVRMPQCQPVLAGRPIFPPVDGAITGLAGVLIWTGAERFAALRHFYVDVLGLTPRTDRPGFANFEWDQGSTRLTLSVHDQLDGAARDPLRVMVNFSVVEIDAVHRRLTEAGVRCIRPPSREPWGGMVSTYADPDGNVVQMLCLAAAL